MEISMGKRINRQETFDPISLENLSVAADFHR
jgi:hypothetical protein